MTSRLLKSTEETVSREAKRAGEGGRIEKERATKTSRAIKDIKSRHNFGARLIAYVFSRALKYTRCVRACYVPRNF